MGSEEMDTLRVAAWYPTLQLPIVHLLFTLSKQTGIGKLDLEILASMMIEFMVFSFSLFRSINRRRVARSRVLCFNQTELLPFQQAAPPSMERSKETVPDFIGLPLHLSRRSGSPLLLRDALFLLSHQKMSKSPSSIHQERTQ